ncbi:TolC family protein [Deinococcus ruber]|uniref:TolC family protein n=1 Tax=Deinococcus ruber TaxID=1848197 RepID=UPI003571238D
MILGWATSAQSTEAQSVPTKPSPLLTTPPLVNPAPFTLSDALAGLSTSAQYRQAQLALSTAHAQLQAAQANLGPTAGVNGSVSLASGSSTATNGTVSSSTDLSISAGASVSLPVLPWSAAQTAARAYAVARATFAQTSAALTASTELAFAP